MSTNSSIEWTDATWNPVRGCMKVSPGCKHCYAETFAERFRGVKGHAYEQGFALRLVPEKLSEPLSWKKPRRVFVNSMSDLFQDGVPDDFIDQVFAVMALCPQHTFQVLTKRPERMREYMREGEDELPRRWADAFSSLDVEPPLDEMARDARRDGVDQDTIEVTLWERAYGGIAECDWPLPNVWLGVSVENQHFADERIPLLTRTPAAVRFVSAEPLLEEIDFSSPVLQVDCETVIDWVIVGGESGPSARPFDLAWARSIVEQCKAAGVACFVKQLGSNCRAYFNHHEWPAGTRAHVGATMADQQWIQLSKKGGIPLEWPDDLRVREFPETRA